MIIIFTFWKLLTYSFFFIKGTNSLGFHDEEELGPNFDLGIRARVKGIQGELTEIILGAFWLKIVLGLRNVCVQGIR